MSLRPILVERTCVPFASKEVSKVERCWEKFLSFILVVKTLMSAVKSVASVLLGCHAQEYIPCPTGQAATIHVVYFRPVSKTIPVFVGFFRFFEIQIDRGDI